MDPAEAATKSVVEHKGSAGRDRGFSRLSAELSVRCLYGTQRGVVRQNAGYSKTLTRGLSTGGPVPSSIRTRRNERHCARRISGYLNPVFRSIDPHYPNAPPTGSSQLRVMGTFTVLVPAAITTLAGTVATAVLPEVRLIVIRPVGALADRFRANLLRHQSSDRHGG